MARPRRQGFSNTPEKGFSKSKKKHIPSGHSLKEQQALELINQGNLQEAEAVYRELISSGKSNHIVYGNLAAICLMQSRHEESIPLLHKALALKPNHPETHCNLGNALKEQGDLKAAIACYKKALQLKPNYPNAHLNLGNTLKEQGDLTAAIACYKKAFQHKPNYSEAHNNLGIALFEQGDLKAAIASYNTALQLKPDYPDAQNNLGNALLEKGDLKAAIASYNTALQLKPNFPEAHWNLGNAHQEQGDLTAAISSYNAALKLRPNYPEAHWSSSLTMLLGGDYKNGWDEYEWRVNRKKSSTKPHAIPKCDQWGGNIAINQTKQLMLVTEQGLGDTLQFMRYATALRNEGILVSFCAQPKLHTLIQASGIDPSPLTPQQANEVSEGQWIPLLSLPRHLEVSPDNPVITEPYIKTTDELHTKWAETLSAEQLPIVAINWQGNPETENTGLRGRSLALEAFAPIAEDRQISLLSLQKGFGSEQLDTCSFNDRFVSCQDQVNETWDFLETAAIIANCDLIITSDTSVAHLAGGMGKTTWLLLHKVPDWRWGLEGDTTFWYPSMRLFRQTERGDWDEVMKRVAEALKEHFGDNSGTVNPDEACQPAIKPNLNQEVLAPISLGELIDKITILEIKTQHLQGTALENVKKELETLEITLQNLQLNIDAKLIRRLKEVNEDLWQIEDDIRDKEQHKKFDEDFIYLARSVYRQNDFRAAIKKEINTTYGSAFIEEKSYQQY